MNDSFLDDISLIDEKAQFEHPIVRADEPLDEQETDINVHPPYTAVQLAKWCGVGDATIRNRWFDWLLKVAPEPLLKEGKGYSELARTLFLEFKEIPQNNREEWVTEAKARYAQEWSSVGIIEGELMPQSVGGALATIQSSNTDAALALAEEMEAALNFGTQLDEVEAEFSQAELEAMRLRGARRGIMQFKVEAQAAADTYNQLRQKSMGLGAQSE